MARRFGLAQGGCLRPDPGAVGTDAAPPWSRGFLRAYLADWDRDVDWSLLEDDEAWRQPLVAEHFDDTIRDYARRAHAERELFLRWADALPQTLCHHDLWPNNLFHDGPGPLTVIDWALAGHGPLGGDVGNLVSDTALDLIRPAAEIPALDAAAFEGYVSGVRDSGPAGRRVDPGLLRLGMVITAVKWSWLVPGMVARAARERHVIYDGQTPDPHHLYAERAAVLRHLATWTTEAHTLAATHL
ncbi:phosphotransferase [Streptomyces sp. 4N509B]|uniref:phosphotransferase n=1 Tax=Streptomyces sp. 4N509B TaxID=3457413 RepID=UPI003FD3A4EF